jgi:hypothetical protein
VSSGIQIVLDSSAVVTTIKYMTICSLNVRDQFSLIENMGIIIIVYILDREWTLKFDYKCSFQPFANFNSLREIKNMKVVL